MFSKLFFVLHSVIFFGDVLTLVELPQVEENNILQADTAVRQTTNKLFLTLKLEVNKVRPTLNQYLLIHNYLVTTSLHEHNNLKEIAKLTRVDKTRLNNETRNFMTIVNEILNEDINHDAFSEDKYVIRHIEGFLSNLDKYSDAYKYGRNNDVLLTEIIKILNTSETPIEVLKSSGESDASWLLSSDENDTFLFDTEFWTPSSRRIFQGKKTNIKDFPFIVSIQVFNQFQCPGSIIKSDLIITAASCLQLTWNNRYFRENPSFLSVRVGSTYHNGGGENIPVLEIYFHPDYEPNSLLNNLCILRLHRQLKFKRRKGKRMKKIEIDRQPNALPTVMYGQPGIDITVVGWGAKEAGSVVRDRFLSFAILDVYPLLECQAVYSTKYVTQKNFCAGFVSRGGGACNRDIGGPGIMQGVLVGVISFGAPACGTPDAPTVFTKLGYYADWIDSIIAQRANSAKQKTTLLPAGNFAKPGLFQKTTFQITPPLFSKKKISEMHRQVEILRILKEKGMLMDFINSVIGSQEAKELLLESKSRPVERVAYTYSPITTLDTPIGKDDKFSEQQKLYEISDEESSETSSGESNGYSSAAKAPIGTRQDNANHYNLERQNKPEDVIDLHKFKDLERKIEQDIADIVDQLQIGNFVNGIETVHQMPNEDAIDGGQKKDLLKILYLNDKDVREVSSGEHKETGMSIAFRNPGLTSNNDTDPDIFLTKQDLMDIFSEVIKENIKNTTVTIADYPNLVDRDKQKKILKRRY